MYGMPRMNNIAKLAWRGVSWQSFDSGYAIIVKKLRYNVIRIQKKNAVVEIKRSHGLTYKKVQLNYRCSLLKC